MCSAKSRTNSISPFYLENKGFDNRFLVSKTLALRIKIKEGGYIPRSGLMLADFLNRMKISGAILDIGTGETGILAYCLKAGGADDVVACDIDCETIRHASKASVVGESIKWILSDVFDSIQPYLRFDIIVSNPPQLPMSMPGSFHDYGGADGRDVILKIIEGIPNRLKENGKAYILCFDFLGVTRRYGSSDTLYEIAHKRGLDLRIVAEFERQIRKGGKTEENRKWIEKIYPHYKFRKDKEGKIFHKIFITELERIR